MGNKFSHEQIKDYIIKNQKYIFKQIDESIEIVAAEKKCGKCKQKRKTRYEEKVIIGNKWCDLVGISNNYIYFIEIKPNKVIPNDLNKYIETKQSYYYKLKQIKYVFIAPRISEKTKKQIVLNDFMYIELGYDLNIDIRKHVPFKRNVDIKECKELYIIEWLNKNNINQEYLESLTFKEDDAIVTFTFKNGYCINWYLKFCEYFYRYSISSEPYSNILLDIIKPEYEVGYRSHIYYNWNNVEHFMKIMPYINKSSISSRDFKIINEYFNYKFKTKNILRENINNSDIINELI